MRSKKISKSLYAIIIGIAAFTASFLVLVNSVHAVDFSVSFSPAADTIEQNADTAITISFDRAVYADAEGTVFTSAALGNVVSLHTTNADGTAIPFVASINEGNTEISVDPASTLADGAVYVAIRDAYYDEDGAQGDAASAIFFVTAAAPAPSADTTQTPPADTTAPTVTFSPASGATVIDAGVDLGLTFSEAVYMDTGETVFDATTLAGLITLKSTDVNGADIPFTASIDASNTGVTIDPTNDLAVGTVFVAVSDGYYDAAQNQGATATNSFTVEAPAPPTPPADTTAPTVTFSPASGATVDSASTDVILTFSEAVYMDTSETMFDATTLAGLITLKNTDADGADIPFTASINAGDTEVTIDPDNDLADGVVYVAVSDGYYDAAQNQGAAATNSFTIAVPTPPADTTAPTVTFSPASGTTVDSVSADITLTFSETVYMDTSETMFDTTALTGLITLKSTDANGADIPFTASINEDDTEIIIDPDSDLAAGVVYVAVSDGYYDAAQNQGAADTSTFTVAPPAPPAPTTDPVVDSAEFVVTSTPADDETLTDNTASITLTFNQPAYRNSNQALFTTDDLAGFVVLRTDDVYGYGIPFEATMSEDNMTIIIDPVDTLQDGVVYVAISEDYYSADKTRGVSFKANFTVDTGTPQPLDDIFSYLLTSSPVGQSAPSSAIITLGPSIEATEEFKEIKIQEALTLLQQALELLAVAAMIEDVSPTAPALPIQDSLSESEEVDGSTESTTTEGDNIETTPASDTSASDTPSINDLLAEVPSADTPAVDTAPADSTPSPSETPTTDTAPVDPASVDTSPSDTPSADIPSVDSSSESAPEAVVVE